MKLSTKIAIVAVFAVALLFPIHNSYSAWFLGTSDDTIVLDRLDGGKTQEINKGVYGYFDTDAQNWVIVLDFSKSPDPLIDLKGAKLYWN